MRAPLAPPRLSDPRKVEAEAQAVATNSETERPEAEDLLLQDLDVRGVDQLVVGGRDGSCQVKVSSGTSGPR